LHTSLEKCIVDSANGTFCNENMFHSKKIIFLRGEI